MAPSSESFTATIEVAASPHDVFECICDVSKWWGGRDLEGRARRLHDEFTITHGDAHYSKQRVIELVPDRRVVWLVVEGRLGWLERDPQEWTNTRLIFDITSTRGSTRLHFTHDGLVPAKECYARCSSGWNLVIADHLFTFISDGRPHFT